MGEEVGDDPVLARVRGQAGAPPALPRSARYSRSSGSWTARRASAAAGSASIRAGARRVQGFADVIGPGRNLGAGGRTPTPDLLPGVVQADPVAPHRWDRQAHPARVWGWGNHLRRLRRLTCICRR